MSYQSLSRKWRPKTFEDVIGQPHIVRALRNNILQGKVTSPYLMVGTRGVGKTSMARILSMAYRCQDLQQNGSPCLKCESCLDILTGNSADVVEIDGASHNGVDHVRKIIENIHYLPTFGKYRIYIIDEVHMLSKEAFNALLKTFESPPAHIIFILATTVLEKLLSTVLSRCHRLDFQHISFNDLRDRLSYVLEREGFQVENEEVLELIAKEGKGSLRDSLSRLEQVVSYTEGSEITIENVRIALGLARLENIRHLLKALFLGDALKCSKLYQDMIRGNVEVSKLVASILDELYQVLTKSLYKNENSWFQNDGELMEVKISSAELIWIYEVLTKDFTWSLSSIDPVRSTEICLQKVTLRRTFFHGLERSPQAKQEHPSKVKKPAFNLQKMKEEPPRQVTTSPTPQKTGPKTWDGFLQFAMKRSKALAINLEQGNIIGDINASGGKIQIALGFKEESHIFLEYLQDKQVFQNLRELLKQYFQTPLENIKLDLKLVGKGVPHFKNKDEFIREKENKSKADEKQNFLGNTHIQNAQKLFNANIESFDSTQ